MAIFWKMARSSARVTAEMLMKDQQIQEAYLGI